MSLAGTTPTTIPAYHRRISLGFAAAPATARRVHSGLAPSAWEGRRSMEEEVLQPDDASGLDDDSNSSRPSPAPVAAPMLAVPSRAVKRDWALRSVIKGEGGDMGDAGAGAGADDDVDDAYTLRKELRRPPIRDKQRCKVQQCHAVV